MSETIEPEVVNTQGDIGDLVTAGTVVVMGGMAIIVGGSLAMGFATGVGAAMFTGILLWKTKVYKPKVWNTMMDHPLATDCAISGFFIMTIGSMTALGLVAGIVAAGVTTIGIGFAGKYIGKVDGIGSYKIKIPMPKRINVGGLTNVKSETTIQEM